MVRFCRLVANHETSASSTANPDECKKSGAAADIGVGQCGAIYEDAERCGRIHRKDWG